MAISDKQMGDRAAEELSVLNGVIDYADVMHNQRKFEYEPLRRHAYGKTVVIKTEKLGVQTYRLSSTPVVYPNFDSGYATPYSPIGRLCSYLKPGDEDETPRWGEYRVLEIRMFDRFDGPEFEPNVRNFLRMAVDGDCGKAKISHLRDYLDRMQQSAKTVRRPSTPPLSYEKVPAESTTAEIPAIKAEPAILNLVETFAVVEDDDEELGALVVLEEDDPSEVNTQAEEIYFGLNENFYINRTRDQDAVISRSPLGPMFVEGVAGSGKTSAALGRTKMLCDYNAANITEEAEFRAIAGDKVEYWSGAFAGQFSQESSIGFVRTAELIQYLKETCRRLDLPNLPIKEYPELRIHLRTSRKVDRNQPGTPHWRGLAQARGTHTDTTMAWLHAADQALAFVIADLLAASIPTAEAIASIFDDNVRPAVLRVATAAIEPLRAAISKIARNLSRWHGNKEFALDRLAARINEEIHVIRQSVLNSQVLWLILGDQTLTATRESDLARKLLSEKVPLYTKASARLVFVNEHGPIDSTLTFLSKAGEVIQWRAEMRALIEKGEILVREAEGRTLQAQALNEDSLFLSLLPDTTNPIYALSDKGLKRLKIVKGLGRSQYLLKSKIAFGEFDQKDINDEEAPQQTATATPLPQQRTVDALFNTMAKRNLLQPLVYIADYYAQALQQHPERFPDPSLANTIGRQLAERQLGEEDFDLLLCIANNISREFKSSPSELREPSFYQAVFIDEVQDFTEQQVYLMAEQARPEYRAITVVGDLAQKLHNGSVIDVPACFPAKKVPVIQLTENLRQLDAPGLAWFSACFRAEFQDGLIGHEPSPLLASRLRENADQLCGPKLKSIYDDDNLVEELVDILHSLNPYQTAAVIFPDAGMAESIFELCKPSLRKLLIEAELSQKIDLSRRHVRHFTSVAQAKGLEFDVVLVPYLEHYDLSDRSQINALYVALTRSRKQLVLLSHRSRTPSRFDQLYSWYEDTLINVCAPTIP